MKNKKNIYLFHFTDKGTFYSKSAGEMLNRHMKVPKIAPELLFPISGMNLFKAITNMSSCYNQ